MFDQSPGWGDGWVRRLSNKWQISPIVQVRSGSPLTITTGSDTSLTSVGQDRPDLIDPSLAVPAAQYAADWLNRATFAKNVSREAVETAGTMTHI
jgi:hypothetical protein